MALTTEWNHVIAHNVHNIFVTNTKSKRNDSIVAGP